jgi:hypothetical protein
MFWPAWKDTKFCLFLIVIVYGFDFTAVPTYGVGNAYLTDNENIMSLNPYLFYK